MSKNPPPKAAAKRAARKAPAPTKARGKRSAKPAATESKVREKQRALEQKADPFSRAHLKMKFSADDVANVCELIRDELMSLSAACAKLGFRYQTFRDRMRDDEAMNKLVQAARDDMVDDLVDPGNIVAIADDGRRDYKDDGDGGHVVDHDHIQRAKLRIEARFKLRDQIRGTTVNLNHSGKVEARITGLGDLLREISAEGADVGPGPSR